MDPERRYYEIAGITVQVESDLPFADDTFDVKFDSFRREGPGPDTVVIRHHFELPTEDMKAGGDEMYRRPPWAIYRMPDGSWVYEGIAPEADNHSLHRVAVFDETHEHGELYNPAGTVAWWREGGLGSLSLFPTDQIWLAHLLAEREACFLHSGGVLLKAPNARESGDAGRARAGSIGLLFVGHSDAGKSTTMQLVKTELGDRAAILCDDRNIVRRWGGGHVGSAGARAPEASSTRQRRGYWVHGTWSHGDVPEVSAAGAPLRAILFLEQAPANELVALTDRKEVWQRLLVTLIKPMVTAEWLQKEMDILERIAAEVPCYVMRFDRSGAIVPSLEKLAE